MKKNMLKYRHNLASHKTKKILNIQVIIFVILMHLIKYICPYLPTTSSIYTYLQLVVYTLTYY